MSVTQLSQQVGITMANISILKNGRAKAVKLETLDRICRALHCQPGICWNIGKSPKGPKRRNFHEVDRTGLRQAEPDAWTF